MSIINPNIKKSALEIAPSWAKLSSDDGKNVYNFLVNPESIRWQHSIATNSLATHRSAQPETNYQYSTSVLTIPRFYLWTVGNSCTIKNEIAELKAMTKPTILGGKPPILTLTWGELRESRLWLASVEIEEKQWRSGQPTEAEGSMSFIYAPLAISPVKAATVTKATPRQKAKAASKVTPVNPKSTKKISSNGLVIGDIS